MTIGAEVLARLKHAVGAKGFSEDPAEIAPHLKEWRDKYQGRSPLLLKPASTAEISSVLAICNETDTQVVPQGGNTGLVGGQIPFHGEVILSLQRMAKIRAVDTASMSMTVEAGVTLAAAQQAAQNADRYFPLSLASEGSCTIGGNLSTNAGGVAVLRYGNARDLVLGLEAVLADGRVLDMLRGLRKDNTGYDLKQLFIGAEGTLGIITAATLKLFPRPLSIVTAFAAVPDPAAAVHLLGRLQEATGGLISAFEIVPRIGLEFVLAHIPQTADPLRAAVEAALGEAMNMSLVTDATIAASEAQRTALWRLREALSEAQKFEGGSIKHDISVPVASVPTFLEAATRAVLERIPGARPVPFGHIGDGNIHFNISVPKGAGNAEFLARWDEIQTLVHDIVHRLGGSISAEHGLGIMKKNEIARYKSAAEIAVMGRVKRALDPNGILNPGKLLPDG
jgi:FAD/FMN-containing dehydrogenase